MKCVETTSSGKSDYILNGKSFFIVQINSNLMIKSAYLGWNEDAVPFIQSQKKYGMQGKVMNCQR